MNFKDAIELFERSESGTDSFKALYRSLLSQMKLEPINAAAFFVLATAAHNYVLMYEDQAVSAEAADSSKVILLALCKRYFDVIDASAEEKLAAAGMIANEYEWETTLF